MLAWPGVSRCLHLEQIAGLLHISHEKVYRYIDRDKKVHGCLHLHLRCQKPYCKHRTVTATATATGAARWPTKGVGRSVSHAISGWTASWAVARISAFFLELGAQ